MTDARNYAVDERLKDGTAVTIRAIRPEDRRRIVEAFGKLEPESIYTRFFRQKTELTEDELRTVVEVDFDSVVALVVTIPDGKGDEIIIAAGRYVQYDYPNVRRSAEIAFTVEEDYHGQGIASRILKHLVTIGREKGLLQFEAEVLAENRAMIAVFERSGLPMKKSFEEGVAHVSLSLVVQAQRAKDPANPA